jgi:hypothetical protein
VKQRPLTMLLGLATATLALWAPARAMADESCPLTNLNCVTQTVGGSVDDPVGAVGQVGDDPTGAVGTVRDTVQGAIGTVRGIVDDTIGTGSGGGGTDPTGGGGSGGGGTTGTDGGTGATVGGSVSGPRDDGRGVSAGFEGSARIDPASGVDGSALSADGAVTSSSDRHAASRATIGHIAAEVAAGAAALIVLGTLMFGFLLLQDRIDARDPRLAASSHGSDRVAFG